MCLCINNYHYNIANIQYSGSYICVLVQTVVGCFPVYVFRFDTVFRVIERKGKALWVILCLFRFLQFLGKTGVNQHKMSKRRKTAPLIDSDSDESDSGEDIEEVCDIFSLICHYFVSRFSQIFFYNCSYSIQQRHGLNVHTMHEEHCHCPEIRQIVIAAITTWK